MRYISSENRLFLHIPKTGGVSVEAMLDSNFETFTVPQRWNWTPGRHALKDHLLEHPSIRPHPWTFTFVRHPVDWYVSCWRWLHDVQQRQKVKGFPLARHMSGFRWHPYRCLINLWADDFEEWMARILTHQPAFVTRLFELYCGPHGNETVDYIGRCETLDKDLLEIFPSMKPLPRKNKSIHPTVIVPDNLKVCIMASEMVAVNRFYGRRNKNVRYTRNQKNE